MAEQTATTTEALEAREAPVKVEASERVEAVRRLVNQAGKSVPAKPTLPMPELIETDLVGL